MKNRYTKPVFAKREILSRVTAGGGSLETQGQGGGPQGGGPQTNGPV